MDFTDLLSHLDLHTRVWASTLSSEDLASILSAVYRIPGLINALKVNNNVIYYYIT